ACAWKGPRSIPHAIVLGIDWAVNDAHRRASREPILPVARHRRVLAVLHLEPGAAAAGPVRRVAALRHDPLEAEPKGMTEHGAAVLRLDMLDHLDAVGRPAQRARERGLARLKWLLAQVGAVELQDDGGRAPLTASPPRHFAG